MRLPNARRLFSLADSGGGGIPRLAAQRAILALALLAAALAAAALLHSSAAAQTNTITTKITRYVINTRLDHDSFATRYGLNQDRIPRATDLTISGKTTLKFESSFAFTTLPTLSNFTVENGTLSNLRNRQRVPIGITPFYQIWTADLTPTVSGPVTVRMAAGQLQGGAPNQDQRNAAASFTLTAELGPPKALWADFITVGARAIDPTRPWSAGETIDFLVIFSEQVTVSGLPTVQLRTPGGVVDAAYQLLTPDLWGLSYTPNDLEWHNGSGSSVLLFRHTVPAGGYGRGHPSIESATIALPMGAMITDSDGNPADLALPPVFETFETLLTGPGLPRRADPPNVGDAYDFVAAFSEPVSVSVDPGADLAYFPTYILTNAGVTRAVQAVYVGGSGTTRLTFRYVVKAEDDVQRHNGIHDRLRRIMRVPQGFSIRNAAGIELSRPLPKQPQNIFAGYQEGTRVQLRFRFTRPIVGGHDFTVHFVSSDPARVSFSPASVLLRDSDEYPGDWGEWRFTTATLHADDDTADNDVRLSFRLETTHRFDGYIGSWIPYPMRITDTQGGGGPPCFLELVLSLADDSDNVVQAGDSLAVEAKLVYIDSYRMLDIDEPGRLSATGAVHWESNGRNRIGIPMQNLHNLGGRRPCRSVTINGPTTWTCELDTEDSTIVVPVGTPDGVFTIHGAVDIDGLTYRGSLDVTVGDVDEVTSAALDFATDIAPGDSTDTPTNNWTGDDRPYPSSLNLGERTTFQLAVLNENDAASAAGEIDSIVLTTSAGSLSLLNPNGVCVGDDERSCQLPVNLLNATNSDNIRIELAHPGEAGRATVRATVIAADGEEFKPEPLSVIFLGPPETLAISAPDSPMLNFGTPDSGLDRDDLDLLTLSVTAADTAGNTVPVPSQLRFAELRDPAGEVVWSGSASTVQNGLRIDWPLRWRDSGGEVVDTVQTTPGVQPRPLLDPEGNLQVEIDIDAEAAAKLTAGEYTLKLTAGGLSATQRIIVSGAPAAVSLSEPQGDGMAAQGGVITVTATVTDANGNPVTDGTPVTWAEPRLVGESPVLVQVSVDRVTSGGTASASYQVVGSGSSYLRATAGTGSDVQLFNSPAPAAPPPSPAEDLTRRAPGGVSVWLGEGQTTASALLAGIPHATSIRTLRSGIWLRYSVVDGRLIPGSVDFVVRAGDILWPTN